MRTLKIGGKDYPISVTWGRLEKAVKKLKYDKTFEARFKKECEETTDKDELKKLKEGKEAARAMADSKFTYENLIIQIWEYLDRGKLFKPFVFRWRLANKIELDELKPADKILADIISMEDREGKNLV